MEVMVAVAITAGLAMMVARCSLQTGSRSARWVVERDGRALRQLRVAMSRMVVERGFGRRLRSDRFDPRVPRTRTHRPTNSSAERDRLLFTTLAHQRPCTRRQESDQAVVDGSTRWRLGGPRGATAAGPDCAARTRCLDEHMDRGGRDHGRAYEDVRRVEGRITGNRTARSGGTGEWEPGGLERKVHPPHAGEGHPHRHGREREGGTTTF